MTTTRRPTKAGPRRQGNGDTVVGSDFCEAETGDGNVIPDTAQGEPAGTGLRRATTVMAIGTALSRANPGSAPDLRPRLRVGRLRAGRLLQPRQHPAQHRPRRGARWSPVGHVRPGVRPPAEHARRRRGVGRRLRRGERHHDRHRGGVDPVPAGGPLRRRRHHGAQPLRPRRPEQDRGQGPAVPVRAPADLLRLHQRRDRTAQRPAQVRRAHVQPHRQQRRAHRRADHLRDDGAPRHPGGRGRAPGPALPPRLGNHRGRGGPGRPHGPQPAPGGPAASVAPRLPPRSGAHHPPPVELDVRARGGQPGGAGGGIGPVRESGPRGGQRLHVRVHLLPASLRDCGGVNHERDVRSEPSRRGGPRAIWWRSAGAWGRGCEPCWP